MTDVEMHTNDLRYNRAKTDCVYCVVQQRETYASALCICEEKLIKEGLMSCGRKKLDILDIYFEQSDMVVSTSCICCKHYKRGGNDEYKKKYMRMLYEKRNNKQLELF